MSQDYLFSLRERSQKSKVYQPFQLIGLQLAELLEDERHKSLYIKLAKEHQAEYLLGLAKRVAENNTIKNKGAYFMTLLKEDGAYGSSDR